MQQSRFIAILEDLANRNTVPGVFQQIAGQWLAIRLDFLGALIMFFMGALAVSLRQSSFIPAGYLALGLSYSIQLTSMLKMAVRVSATLEAQFNSVERVKFYVEMQNVEGQDEDVVTVSNTLTTPDISQPSLMGDVGDGDVEMNNLSKKKKVFQPPEHWPTEGRVRFENVQMSYRDGPLVLKGVSFEVAARDKIGIAGRTG
jgi:ATP-binding cassette, subfamily C (CFTR/MRP), member 1